MRLAVPSQQVNLPRIGTKIHVCLLAIAREYPRKVSSGEIAHITRFQAKDTASLMGTLMARGLLARVEERRGMPGGSIWELTPRAIELLDAKRRSLRRRE